MKVCGAVARMPSGASGETSLRIIEILGDFARRSEARA
jgi:hypothetical protein